MPARDGIERGGVFGEASISQGDRSVPAERFGIVNDHRRCLSRPMTSVLIDPVSDRVWETEMPWKWSVRGGFQAALDAVAAVHGTEYLYRLNVGASVLSETWLDLCIDDIQIQSDSKKTG